MLIIEAPIVCLHHLGLDVGTKRELYVPKPETPNPNPQGLNPRNTAEPFISKLQAQEINTPKISKAKHLKS